MSWIRPERETIGSELSEQQGAGSSAHNVMMATRAG